MRMGEQVAPSTELRKWYGHEPDRFDEFSRRYRSELEEPERAEALATLRKAFDETMKDPAFLARARKSRMLVSPPPGIEVRKLVAKYAVPPPAEVERARKLIGLKD